MERHVLTRAQQSLRPELYARINEKLVFNRLTYETQLEIAQMLLDAELRFLRGKGCELVAANAVLPFLVRHGFHARLGARPMRDTVEKFVGDAVALDLLEFSLLLRAERHRREHPNATEEEVAAIVHAWRTDRPGAPDGDAVGRSVSWPRVKKPS